MTGQLFHHARRTLREAILKDKANAETGRRHRPRYVLMSSVGTVILTDATRTGFETILSVEQRRAATQADRARGLDPLPFVTMVEMLLAKRFGVSFEAPIRTPRRLGEIDELLVELREVA